MPKLLIIDGSGYIFRAYYAVRPLSTAAGEPVNAVYGFATMLEKTLREESPEYIAMAFDTAGPTFRNTIYAEYKAHRPPPPPDLISQFARIHQVVEAYGLKQFSIPGVEADDVIATLVRRGLAEGFDVRLITGDKDLMQLVSPRVSVYEPMRDQHFDAAGVDEKLGVPPELVRDALSLAGDAADNVPGVAGVGMKTAAKFLKQYGSAEKVLAAAKNGEIKGKMGERLAAASEAVALSRQLVTLKEDVALEINSIADLKYAGPNISRLTELFTELEFRRLIPKATETDSPTPKVQINHLAYTCILDSSSLKTWAEKLHTATSFAISVETDKSRAIDATLLGIAFATEANCAAYLPLAHTDANTTLSVDEIWATLRPIFSRPEVKYYGDQSKLWHSLCTKIGIQLPPPRFDPALASYLLTPDDGPHLLPQIARRHLGIVLDEADNKAAPLDTATATQQLAERADVTWRLAQTLPAELEAAGLSHVFLDLELPLIPVLSRMELAGVKIAVEQLHTMSDWFAKEITRLESECYSAAGHEFNLSSPKQLQKVLFEELGLKITKRTKTGPSTDQSVLEALADNHPLPSALLEHRQMLKLKSTYIDALPKMVCTKTGRVHTLFNQTIAATGRLSSTDPNLQNIPIRSELGRNLRKVFIAEPDHCLISVDYSQVELRVLAHLSQDSVLTQAFRENADVHTRTASVLFNIPPEQVSREQRTQAKAVNFGVLYGMGPVRLARELKIPRRVASDFVKDYFEKQTGVRTFIEQTLALAKETGMVKTILGRHRLLPDINSENRGLRAAAERVAINTPIQGSAADLIKLAMIRVDALLGEQHPKARLILQVHDELLVEAPKTEAEAVAALVKREMQNVFPLDVPLIAEAHIGTTWDEAH